MVDVVTTVNLNSFGVKGSNLMAWYAEQSILISDLQGFSELKGLRDWT